MNMWSVLGCAVMLDLIPVLSTGGWPLYTVLPSPSSGSVVTPSGMAPQNVRPGLDPPRSMHDDAIQTTQKKESLPQQSVQVIAQTPQTYLWIRPQEGLIRFDVFLVVCGAAITLLLGMAFRFYQLYNRRILATVQLEAELTQAQLQTMKAQLHPHFLFNTLNTISVLTDESPKKANRMILLLSDLLRQILDTSQADEVTLRRELELLGAYVEIQRMRFRRRLAVSYDVDDRILDAKLPSLILQPLVENAIRHGIAKQRTGGQIDIRAYRSNGSLLLQVRDDGPGLCAERVRERNGNGIGLSNTSKRLSCIYGSRSSMKIERLEPRGTLATIVIPYHETGKQS